jgi:hypothetical protein
MKGYSLIYSVIHGNVLGCVIAPKGTEHLPKAERMFVWRASIRPLVAEIAEAEEFPADDARQVAEALFHFCQDEGLVVAMDDDRPSGV